MKFDEHFREHSKEEGTILAVELPSNKVPAEVYKEIALKQGHVRENRDDAYYIVRELVENGADFDRKDKEGKTAKDYASLNPENKKAKAYLEIVSNLYEAVKNKNIEKIVTCFKDEAIKLVRLDEPLKGFTLWELAKQTKDVSIIGLIHLEIEFQKPYPETTSLIFIEKNYETTLKDFKFIFDKSVEFFELKLSGLVNFLNYPDEGKNILSFPLGPEKTSFIYEYLVKMPEFKCFLDNLSLHLENANFDQFLKKIETLLDYKNRDEDDPLKMVGKIFHNPSFLLASHQIIKRNFIHNNFNRSSIVINHTIQSCLDSMSATADIQKYSFTENKLQLTMNFLGNVENCQYFIERIVRHSQSFVFSDQFIRALINLSASEICDHKHFIDLIKFLIKSNENERIVQFLLNPNTFSHLSFNKLSTLLDILPELFNHLTEKNINSLEKAIKNSKEKSSVEQEFNYFIKLTKIKKDPKLFSKINDRGLEAQKLINLFNNNPHKQTILSYLQENGYRFFEFLYSTKNYKKERILNKLTNILKYVTDLSKEISELRKMKSYWFIDSITCNKNLINQKINLKEKKLKAVENFLQDLFNKVFDYTIYPAAQLQISDLWKGNILKMFEDPNIYQGRLQKNIDSFLEEITDQNRQAAYYSASMP